ncbi:MAG: hypothetical protein EP298_04655 [Gammaproteobacteria bacterium]|nr:MAG: hypothetical protein EP298_04655 [Gammaproteobacteria bacterium]UTW42578.1 hypothetical protein KFE69_00045 [bacterium SCSIO 12844]
MLRVKLIQTSVDILMYITMIIFIVLLFCTFQLKAQFNFLYQHLWVMLVFPIFSAWLVFARNRLIDHFTSVDKVDEKSDQLEPSTLESDPAVTADKDKS